MHSHDRTLLSRLGFADPDKKDPRHDLACEYLATPANHLRLAQTVLKPAWDAAPAMERRADTTWFLGSYVEMAFEFHRTFDRLTTCAPVLEDPITKGAGQYATTVGFIDAILPFAWRETRAGRLHGYVAERYVDVPQQFYSYALDRVPEGESKMFVGRSEIPEALRAAFPCVRSRFAYGESGFECTRIRRGDAVTLRVPQYARGWFGRTEEEAHRGVAIVEVKVQPVGVGEVLRQIKLYREYRGPRGCMRFFEGDRDAMPDPALHWVLATVYPMPREDVARLRAERITHIRLGERFDAYVKARSEAPVDDGKESPEL